MFYIITKSIYTITKILFYVNIILLFSYLSLFAEKTGTLEALILSWSEARKSCDFETNASKKDSHCDTQLQYEQDHSMQKPHALQIVQKLRYYLR